jgi:hypothetical protein
MALWCTLPLNLVCTLQHVVLTLQVETSTTGSIA